MSGDQPRRLLSGLVSTPARGAKINSSDPVLSAVCTAYPSEPFQPLLHPPIELPALDQVAVSTCTGGSTSRRWRSRIEDLARGNHSQEELAEKYGITLQTMRQFSARNADEIAARKAELQGELNAATVHLWVSEKAEILAYYKMMLDQLRPKLTDSGLDDRVRSRFNRDAKALLHDCSELEGLLQARSRVELEVTNAELPPPGTKWVQVTADDSAADS